jgi:hypothetical protein
MTETVSRKHPLFDPASLYSRMRASIRLADKMRGYIHWLQARAKRAREPLPRIEPALPEELRRRTCALAGISAEAVLPAGGRLAVLDILEVRTCVYLVHAELLLVREEDGMRTLGMLLRMPADVLRGQLECFAPWLRGQRSRCQALLFEPEVVQRLRVVLGTTGEGPADAILQAFQPDVVATNFEVVRILAAVPELEGEIQPSGEARFCRLPIPDRCDAFPPRAEPLHVVIVLHPEREEGSSNERS